MPASCPLTQHFAFWLIETKHAYFSNLANCLGIQCTHLLQGLRQLLIVAQQLLPRESRIQLRLKSLVGWICRKLRLKPCDLGCNACEAGLVTTTLPDARVLHACVHMGGVLVKGIKPQIVFYQDMVPIVSRSSEAFLRCCNVR